MNTEDIEKQLKNELGENLKQNVILRDYVSMHVGGVADYFFVAKDISELTAAVSTAYKMKLPYFVLGGGYNVIPSDNGFPGLVIKNESSNIVFSPDFSTVIADSGVNLGRLISLSAGRDLGGLEFLYGVPSTVGGAIYGNAGSAGHAIGDSVKSVTLLVPVDGELKVVKHGPDWMNFSYRSTRLKTAYCDEKFKPVILTATIQLVQRRKDEILKALKECVENKKKNQPLGEYSAGSFFKNPGNVPEKAAGYMLDQAGAKKLRHGGAAFSKKHANFLINRKNATAEDIKSLAEEAKAKVNDKFGVNLEEEIEYIGRW